MSIVNKVDGSVIGGIGSSVNIVNKNRYGNGLWSWNMLLIWIGV